MEIFGTPRDSLVSRLDPRSRVVAAFAYAIVMSFCRSPGALSVGFALAVALVVAARLSPPKLLSRLVLLNAVFILLGASVALSLPGEVVWQIGPASFTREGLYRAMVILLRANAIVLCVAALLGTMEASRLGFALDRLGLPSSLTHVILFMVRYIEVIHQEYHRLRNAMRLRAFRPRCNRHTLRAFGHLIGLLLVRTLDRSERILAAMKCRGFCGRFYILQEQRLSSHDAVFGWLFACALGSVIVLEVLCARL